MNTPPRNLVLVVEDDYATQLFMKTLLSREFRIEIAPDAQSARRVLQDRAGELSLVLMDLSLGGGEDGISLTHWIREQPDLDLVPVIATTAHALQGDRRMAMDAGCDDFLSKPLDRKRLLEAVRRAVGATPPTGLTLPT